MKMLEGYQKAGYVLLIKKALYDLRKLPKLWYKDLTKSLKELGFEQILEEPCCWRKKGILFFFYIDDIVLGYKLAKQAMAN
jgi:hypothetical protein